MKYRCKVISKPQAKDIKTPFCVLENELLSVEDEFFREEGQNTNRLIYKTEINADKVIVQSYF